MPPQFSLRRATARINEQCAIRKNDAPNIFAFKPASQPKWIKILCRRSKCQSGRRGARARSASRAATRPDFCRYRPLLFARPCWPCVICAHWDCLSQPTALCCPNDRSLPGMPDPDHLDHPAKNERPLNSLGRRPEFGLANKAAIPTDAAPL